VKELQTRDIVLVGLFAALTAVGAFIKIPLPYVPITLQVFFVLMAGLILGSKLGALSQIVYLTIGLIGIPIFAEGGGPGYVFHPSFGYLVGFIAAAWVMGKIVPGDKIPTRLQVLYSSAAALAVIYLFGIPYLYLALNHFVGKELAFLTVFKIGMSYLPGDAIKIAILTLTGPAIVRGVRSNLREETTCR
jgi:biotin transport system substrate-specific component